MNADYKLIMREKRFKLIVAHLTKSYSSLNRPEPHVMTNCNKGKEEVIKMIKTR